MFLRPLYHQVVTNTVTVKAIFFITWSFYITRFNNLITKQMIKLTQGNIDAGGILFNGVIFQFNPAVAVRSG